MKIKLKSIYEKPLKEDGIRILTDRLWPRGLTKAKANVDLWLKDIAPSAELRKWFGHDPTKWNEFRRRYKEELKRYDEQISRFKEQFGDGIVTLIYGTKDKEHNQAVVLKEIFTFNQEKKSVDQNNKIHHRRYNFDFDDDQKIIRDEDEENSFYIAGDYYPGDVL
jgi:uncharacterized protein YeaO (DUF488 family)